MSSQPPMESYLAFLQNDILYSNVLPISSQLRFKATFPVSQGWLIIAGYTLSRVFVIFYLECLCLIVEK